MRIRINGFEIALYRWKLPISYISFTPRPNEYGIDIAVYKLFQFWVAIDFNKYNKDGFLILKEKK